MIQFDEHIFQMGWFNHQLFNAFMAGQPTPLTYPPRNKGSIRHLFFGKPMVNKPSWRTMILGRSHHQLPEVHHPFGRWGAFNLRSEVRCIYHGSEKKHGRQDCWGDDFFVFVFCFWLIFGEKTMRNLKEITSRFWNDWISGDSDSEDDTVDGSEIRLTSWYGKCPFLFF